MRSKVVRGGRLLNIPGHAAPHQALYDRLEGVVGTFCPGLAMQPYHLDCYGARQGVPA